MDRSQRNGEPAATETATQPDNLFRPLWREPGTCKNERPCLRCGKSFWAWDTGRARCYLCVPPDPLETQRILAAIGAPPSKGPAPNGNAVTG